MRRWLKDLRLKVSVGQMLGGQCGAGNFNINVKQPGSHKDELFYLFEVDTSRQTHGCTGTFLKHQAAPLGKSWRDTARPVSASFTALTNEHNIITISGLHVNFATYIDTSYML